MCIYLNNSTDLHYEKQEHIIPAGLGGLTKLDRGVVSDEFNLLMSSLEKRYMNDSIFAGFSRIVQGPGERGNLADDKQVRSNVHVLVNKNDPNDLTLGYIKKGVPHELPQLCYDIRTKAVRVQFPNDQAAKANDMINELLKICRMISSLKTYEITSDLLPLDVFVFGYLHGRKRPEAFFAKNPQADFNFSPELIEEFGAKLTLDPQTAATGSNHVISNRTNTLEPDFYRVPGKTAFNYLAHLKGAAFMQQDCFDSIRSWITNGGDNNFVTLTQEKNHAVQRIVGLLPPYAHAVLISQGQGHIFGHVIIYGHWVNLVVLTRNAPALPPSNITGLICDWKNRQELSLEKLLHYVRQ
jgi:hypothetical protein